MAAAKRVPLAGMERHRMTMPKRLYTTGTTPEMKNIQRTTVPKKPAVSPQKQKRRMRPAPETPPQVHFLQARNRQQTQKAPFRPLNTATKQPWKQ